MPFQPENPQIFVDELLKNLRYWEILGLGNWEIAFTQPERYRNHSGVEQEISQFPNSKIQN
jgi:hypothetical protein